MEVKEEKMVAQEAEEKAQVQDGEEWVEVEEDVEEGESSTPTCCGSSRSRRSFIQAWPVFWQAHNKRNVHS